MSQQLEIFQGLHIKGEPSTISGLLRRVQWPGGAGKLVVAITIASGPSAKISIGDVAGPDFSYGPLIPGITELTTSAVLNFSAPPSQLSFSVQIADGDVLEVGDFFLVAIARQP